MRPGVLMVIDPQPRQAEADVESMLQLLDAEGDEAVTADSGIGWAAAVIAPPADEPSCGAAIVHEQGDVLAWAGEVFLPDGRQPRHHFLPAENIAVAILRQLRRDGIDSLERLDGAFCGAWFDSVRDRWIIFNDRMGLLPVFWAVDDQRLVVAPRAWVTWRATRASLTINPAGVADLIRTQNMTEDHTLIDGVYWLRRGHVLAWSEEGAGCIRYWNPVRAPDASLSADDAMDWYHQALRTSLERRISSEAPLMLGISGGVDSRLFLAVAEELGRVPRCFTAGWPFYEDVRFGRRLARVAGAYHDIAELDERTLPQRLCSAIIETDGLQSAAHLAPATAASAYLRRHCGAVLLEGFFHGLLGGSTVPFEEDATSGLPAHQTRWARGTLHSGGDVEAVNALLEPRFATESYAAWSARIDALDRRVPVQDPLARVEHIMLTGRRGRIDVLGTALLREDVLVRNPAADRALLEWHLGVPARMRQGRRLYLELLRQRFRRYAQVPRADGCGSLPIGGGNLRREFHWQYAKAHAVWVGLLYPWTRTWGTSSAAIRAWTFDTWRRAGDLDILMCPDARVLEWVRPAALRELWDRSVRDPLQAEPLLTLATLETMIRWLEQSSGIDASTPARGRYFRACSDRTKPDNRVAALASS